MRGFTRTRTTSASDVASSGQHEPAVVPASPVALAEPDAGEQVVGSASEQAEWTPPTWEELVREHSPRVYRLAYRLTGNQHDAEDLTQDVFIKVFRSLHTFTPGTLEGWMHRITTNTFLDQARRRQRLRFIASDTVGEREPAKAGLPDTSLDDAGLAPDLARALAALPPEQRACVVLCDVEGLSYDEVARVLDVKPGTVRSRIHRGRQSMRAALAHREPRPDHERYLGVPDDFDAPRA